MSDNDEGALVSDEQASQFQKAAMFSDSVYRTPANNHRAISHAAGNVIQNLEELEKLRACAAEWPGGLNQVLRYVADEARVMWARVNNVPMVITPGVLARASAMHAHPGSAKKTREKQGFLILKDGPPSSNDLLRLYRINLKRQLEILDSFEYVDLPDVAPIPVTVVT